MEDPAIFFVISSPRVSLNATLTFPFPEDSVPYAMQEWHGG
jgi:hypothetical protein